MECNCNESYTCEIHTAIRSAEQFRINVKEILQIIARELVANTIVLESGQAQAIAKLELLVEEL